VSIIRKGANGETNCPERPFTGGLIFALPAFVGESHPGSSKSNKANTRDGR
jgi:hypothetical protein